MTTFHPSGLPPAAVVPKVVLKLKTISAGAKLCYGALARLDGIKGECFPKVSTLAEVMGTGERQVQRYLTELEQAGLLTRRKQSHKNGKHRANRYVFLWNQCFTPYPDDAGVTDMTGMGDRYDTPWVTDMTPIGFKKLGFSSLSTSTENTLPQEWGTPQEERAALDRIFEEIGAKHPAGRNPLPNLAAQNFISRCYIDQERAPLEIAKAIQRQHGLWSAAWAGGREPKDLHNWFRDVELAGDIGPSNGQPRERTTAEKWEELQRS